MQQPYLLPSEDRLRHWKDFRTTLDASFTDEECLLKVMNYWNQYPTDIRYIDPYAPEEWPTPWELIHDNEFCRSSLAYMMLETLLMSNDNRWTDDRLRLKYINDSEFGDDFIILVVDDKYVLNYDRNKIINFDIIKKMCIIYHEYSIDKNVYTIV